MEPRQEITNTATQLYLDFSERFLDVAWKETDKAVVAILRGLAALGLNEAQVDQVMTTIGQYAPGVADHAKKE